MSESEQETWKKHFETGLRYEKNGDMLQAADSFRQAIALAPDEPYPHYELGYILFSQQRHAEALLELRETDRLSPGFFQVQTEIYLCETVQSGDLSLEALEILRLLQQLTDMGNAQSEEAVDLSRRAIELAPACALGYFYLGQGLLHDNAPIAEKSLLHCLSLQPDDTTAINAKMNLGLIYQARGDVEKTRTAWQSILAEYEGNPHTRMCQVMLSQLQADED